MATRQQKFKVGLFLVVCFAAMVGATVYLSGFYEEQGLPYWIVFDESVLGLYEGGLVEYLGVDIGNVENIEVTQNNQVRVDIIVDPREAQLRRGVEGQLVIYSLAAGTMAISLSGGEGGQPLPPNSQIPTKPSMFSAVSGSADRILTDFTQIAGQIKAGLAGLEEGELTDVVTRVNTLLGEGEAFIADGRELVTETKTTVVEVRGRAGGLMDEVEGLARELRSVSKNVDTLVVAANEKLTELEVAETQAEVRQVLVNMAELSSRLNDAMAKFDELTASMLHESDNVEHSLQKVAREFADALDAVRDLVIQVKNDPGALLRGSADERDE